MKAVVEPLEGNKVKLSVEVDEREFERALDTAFKKIAREVRVPGFRPGKVPRRVLEARIGKDAARQEALRDALPDYYAQAVRENDIDVIAAPEIDITSGQEEGPVAFDAVVEVRPQLQLVGYGGLRVTVPNPAITDDDIQAQIDRLREGFGELNTVERPAREKDYVSIDVTATRGGETVPGLDVQDYLYEVGSGTVVPELDAQLHGSKPGDILQFQTTLPGDDQESSFRVLVKEVKEKVLPEVTDEWAGEASEFDTVEELKADITKRLSLVKRVQAQMALRNGAVEALVELVDDDAPEPLVDAEMERRLHDLGHRLEAQQASFGQYLQAIGQTQEQFLEGLRAEASVAVKADLALRAVAEAETIEADDDDLDKYIADAANRSGAKPEQLRRQLERTDQLPAVRSDVRKAKALEWLVEHAEVVDDEGHPIEKADLEPQPADEVPEPETAENAATADDVESGETE